MRMLRLLASLPLVLPLLHTPTVAQSQTDAQAPQAAAPDAAPPTAPVDAPAVTARAPNEAALGAGITAPATSPAAAQPYPGEALTRAPPASSYAYPPPAGAHLLQELSALDARLLEVQRARAQHGVGGPIAMLATGYGSALLFTAVALAEWSVAEHIEDGDFTAYNRRFERPTLVIGKSHRYDVNDDGRVDGADEQQARRLGRAFAGLSLAGLGLGVAGTVLLTQRLAKRREYLPELNALRTRRNQLMRDLQYGAGYSYGALTVSLGGRF